MRHHVFLLAALSLGAGIPISLPAQASTVILVRHAEKAGETGDVDLSSAGRARAEDLKAALAAFPVQTILVSEYKRTLQTAEPTATALHLTPVAIPVNGKAAAQIAATAAAIRKLPAGTAALVVGHSNTVGQIIEALGGPHLGDLCDAEYATIFVLELSPTAPPRLLRASYGVPDAPPAVACHHTMEIK
ncbi:MAG TPA: histidine phosphatase family protein [Gemmatimonadales bacterium]